LERYIKTEPNDGHFFAETNPGILQEWFRLKSIERKWFRFAFLSAFLKIYTIVQRRTDVWMRLSLFPICALRLFNNKYFNVLEKSNKYLPILLPNGHPSEFLPKYAAVRSS